MGEMRMTHENSGTDGYTRNQLVSTSDMPPSEWSAPICVVVVDDQVILREGVAALLESDPRIRVVGLGGDGHQAIELARTVHPEVVLMDIRMPNLDGIHAIREIKACCPDVHVIILTAFIYDGYLVEGLMAGADGYLLKNSSPASLVSGIVAVAAGQKVMEPTVAEHVTGLLSKHSAERDHYDGLTQRELQMVAMVARGLVAKEIAHELHISEKTVRNHISNIYRKLGIFDRSQAVLYAIRKGLVIAE
jgi:DNA-binding NarL/FixJ family response regulator